MCSILSTLVIRPGLIYTLYTPCDNQSAVIHSTFLSYAHDLAFSIFELESSKTKTKVNKYQRSAPNTSWRCLTCCTNTGHASSIQWHCVSLTNSNVQFTKNILCSAYHLINDAIQRWKLLFGFPFMHTDISNTRLLVTQTKLTISSQDHSDMVGENTSIVLVKTLSQY